MSKILYLIFIAVLFVFDQLSKWAITENVIRPALGEAFLPPLNLAEWLSNAPGRLPFTSIEVLPFFNIVMVWNQGISFGLFNHDNGVGPFILMGISSVISLIFLIWLFRTTSKLQSFAIVLVIAGALGNVVDRARFGAVIDFLDFHVAGYHWPAFNVADSCICIGVFLLIIQSFFFETTAKDAKQTI